MIEPSEIRPWFNLKMSEIIASKIKRPEILCPNFFLRISRKKPKHEFYDVLSGEIARDQCHEMG